MNKHIEEVKEFKEAISNITWLGLTYPNFFDKVGHENFKISFMGIECEFQWIAQFYNDLMVLLNNYIEDMEA